MTGREIRASTTRRIQRGGRVALALIATTLAASTPRADVIERTMATVEGRVILLSDVQAALALGLEVAPDTGDPVAGVLRRLIDRELILTEVERYQPPAPSSLVVQTRLEPLRARLGSPEAFEQILRRFGLDEAQVADRIRDDLRIETYLQQRFGSFARPTDDAILQYYRAHRAEFVRSDRTVPLTEVADSIRRLLAQQERQALIGEWVDDLRRRATVVAPGLPPS